VIRLVTDLGDDMTIKEFKVKWGTETPMIIVDMVLEAMDETERNTRGKVLKEMIADLKEVLLPDPFES
jgi:hypothetical protein